MDKFDRDQLDYIISHNGSCGEGACSTCIITRYRGGRVVECSTDEALKIAKLLCDK